MPRLVPILSYPYWGLAYPDSSVAALEIMKEKKMVDFSTGVAVTETDPDKKAAINRRALALEIAAKLNPPTCGELLTAARQIELYLKDGMLPPTPKT